MAYFCFKINTLPILKHQARKISVPGVKVLLVHQIEFLFTSFLTRTSIQIQSRQRLDNSSLLIFNTIAWEIHADILIFFLHMSRHFLQFLQYLDCFFVINHHHFPLFKFIDWISVPMQFPSLHSLERQSQIYSS